MTFRKVFTAISVVSAGIAMVPGFLVGRDTYNEMFRTEVYGKSLILISYPPDWQCKIAGAVAALLCFLLVLLSLRGLASLTVWVFGGFGSKGSKAAEVQNWPC